MFNTSALRLHLFHVGRAAYTFQLGRRFFCSLCPNWEVQAAQPAELMQKYRNTASRMKHTRVYIFTLCCYS